MQYIAGFKLMVPSNISSKAARQRTQAETLPDEIPGFSQSGHSRALFVEYLVALVPQPIRVRNLHIRRRAGREQERDQGGHRGGQATPVR